MASEGDHRGVLVVDDSLETVYAISQVPLRAGLEPRPVGGSRRVIEAAVADPQHLALMAVQMPGMSGFGVCRWLNAYSGPRRLKERVRAHDTPVIFPNGAHDPQEQRTAEQVRAVPDSQAATFIVLAKLAEAHDAGQPVERVRTFSKLLDSKCVGRIDDPLMAQVRRRNQSAKESEEWSCRINL